MLEASIYGHRILILKVLNDHVEQSSFLPNGDNPRSVIIDCLPLRLLQIFVKPGDDAVHIVHLIAVTPTIRIMVFVRLLRVDYFLSKPTEIYEYFIRKKGYRP